MSRYQPPIVKIKFDPLKIAEPLWLTGEQVLEGFSDARVVSRFSEYWAAKVYGFVKCKNTNEAGYDGYIDSENTLQGVIAVAIRSIGKSGIKFQQSKFIGSGRKCTVEDLVDSLKHVDYEIVIDITSFPDVLMLPIKSDILLNFVRDGLLKPSGWSKNKFYTVLFADGYDVAKVISI